MASKGRWRREGDGVLTPRWPDSRGKGVSLDGGVEMVAVSVEMEMEEEVVVVKR